ncbi:hypothetical protein D3C84_761810 [compost metagenome]
MHVPDQRRIRRLLGQRLAVKQLVERGIARRRRPQVDRLDPRQTQVELLGRRLVALGYLLQLLTEQLDVQLHGAVADAFGVDLLGHLIKHPAVILLLQVKRQALLRRLLAFATVHLVPGHFHGQPLLGPVTGEPGDEIAFGKLLHAVFPHAHGASGIVIDRAGTGQ